VRSVTKSQQLPPVLRQVWLRDGAVTWDLVLISAEQVLPGSPTGGRNGAIFYWKDSRWKERYEERQRVGILYFSRSQDSPRKVLFPAKAFLSWTS